MYVWISGNGVRHIIKKKKKKFVIIFCPGIWHTGFLAEHKNDTSTLLRFGDGLDSLEVSGFNIMGCVS